MRYRKLTRYFLCNNRSVLIHFMKQQHRWNNSQFFRNGSKTRLCCLLQIFQRTDSKRVATRYFIWRQVYNTIDRILIICICVGTPKNMSPKFVCGVRKWCFWKYTFRLINVVYWIIWFLVALHKVRSAFWWFLCTCRMEHSTSTASDQAVSWNSCSVALSGSSM